VIQATVISILGFFALWGAAFFVYFFLAPGRIYSEQKGSIEELQKTISDLTPKVSKQEQEQRRLVREKLAAFSAQEKDALRHILQHGSTHYDSLVKEFGHQVAQSVVAKGLNSNLIVRAHPMHDINPVFESAARHYFFDE
jgi:dsDNA-binding SOS-regulon protein